MSSIKSWYLVYNRLILLDRGGNGGGNNGSDNSWKDEKSAKTAEEVKMDIIAHKNKKTKTTKISILINSYLHIAFFIRTYNV